MPPPEPVKRVHGALESLNCDAGRGLALALLAALLLLPMLAGESGREWLRYDRQALAAGQWWRLATAHLVHLSWRHALLNVLGLALLWALFVRDYSVRQWLWILAAAALAIDAGLWLLDSTVRWYVGSSGVLHGVLAAGALAHLRRREPEGFLLAALLAGKLLYEHLVGALPLAGEVAVVLPAHLYGALGGGAAALAVGVRGRPL
ncbi:MAG: rhombosortase [Gammaproteobacteria bacterium]|nr:rhombosortase [Gammaproteobacteria bacterium]MBV9620963.1 rhombosortase [Gammaproteobacteria bacterium]